VTVTRGGRGREGERERGREGERERGREGERERGGKGEDSKTSFSHQTVCLSVCIFCLLASDEL
jgi:hypothetical protein